MSGIVKTNMVRRILPFMLLALFLAIVPVAIPAYWTDLLTFVLIYYIYAISFDLLLGYLGLISFGHQIFWGTGAYLVGILITKDITANFGVILFLSIAVAFVLAAILGALVLRTTGTYFSFVNMAFGMAFFALSSKWIALTKGTDGLSGFGRPWDMDGMSFYYFVFVFFIVSFLLMRWITSSRYGHILIGIRENEDRMRSLGYNTWVFKYSAYIIAGIFGIIAGVLTAYHNKIVSPDDYGFLVSGMALLMCLVGGRASQVGAFIGAVIVVFLFRVVSQFTEHWLLIVGVTFVGVVLFAREGAVGYYYRLKDRFHGISNN
jgi:branched-chain amino acid transport system permease protein